MQRLYKSSEQREEKGDNTESGCRGYAKHGPATERKGARIPIADAETIQIKGAQDKR